MTNGIFSYTNPWISVRNATFPGPRPPCELGESGFRTHAAHIFSVGKELRHMTARVGSGTTDRWAIGSLSRGSTRKVSANATMTPAWRSVLSRAGHDQMTVALSVLLQMSMTLKGRLIAALVSERGGAFCVDCIAKKLHIVPSAARSALLLVGPPEVATRYDGCSRCARRRLVAAYAIRRPELSNTQTRPGRPASHRDGPLSRPAAMSA